MGSAITRLLIMLNDENFNSVNYHIASVLINYFSKIHELTIGDVAVLCSVSKSKISKFIREIGYEDYLTFKAEAVFSSQLQKSTNFLYILESIEQRGRQKYINTIIEDIKELNNSLELKKIELLAEQIFLYDKVATFGTLQSEIAALQLQTRLAYCNKYILTNMNETKQNEYIKSAKEDTLIIIFSDTGNYMEREQLTEGNFPKKTFDQTKAKIVLITSNPYMMNHPHVDICIQFCYTSDVHTYSILYSLITDYIAYFYQKYKNQKKL